MRRSVIFLVATLVLACTPQDPDAGDLEQYATFAERPSGQACLSDIEGPKVTQIVTETVLVQPARIGPDGAEITPAIYRKVQRPSTFTEGDGRWFVKVCDALIDTDLIASLQRALAARGAYRGAITQQLDPRTRRAVRAYQAPRGIDSDVPSQAMLVEFGLLQGEPS